MAEFPKIDQVIIRRQVLVLGNDLTGVQEVLGDAEYSRCGVWEPHNMLEGVLVRVVLEVVPKVSRFCHQETLLDAERQFPLANQDDGEYRMWVTKRRNEVSLELLFIPSQVVITYSQLNGLSIISNSSAFSCASSSAVICFSLKMGS